jgi:hypothetical protein
MYQYFTWNPKHEEIDHLEKATLYGECPRPICVQVGPTLIELETSGSSRFQKSTFTFHRILGKSIEIAKKHLLASLCMSVCLSACISAVPTGGIFVKFDTGNFYENPSINSKFGWNRTKLSGTLREDLSTFTLLKAIRNMVYLDNRAKRDYSAISMTTVRFMLVTAIFTSTTKNKHIVAFP